VKRFFRWSFRRLLLGIVVVLGGWVFHVQGLHPIAEGRVGVGVWRPSSGVGGFACVDRQ